MSKKFDPSRMNKEDVKDIAQYVINDLRDLVRQQIDLAFEEAAISGIMKLCGPTELVRRCAECLHEGFEKHIDSLDDDALAHLIKDRLTKN